MDNKTVSSDIKDFIENNDNIHITENNNDNNNKDIRHENVQEETTTSPLSQEGPPLGIISDISDPQNTTQQVSELPIIPSNLNTAAASKFVSDVVVPTSIIGSNVAAHQKSKSRHQLSSSEAFTNLDDNVNMRPDLDTMTYPNWPREPRRSAPVPYIPTTEFEIRKSPRPNSQIILPTSMKKYNSILTLNSDQEFHMPARIINWPTQNHDHHQQSRRNLVGLNTQDNLVDDSEIIFDTTSYIQQSDIQQPSHGQIPSYIPQGRFSVPAATHQVTNLSRAPEVPSFLSTNYGTEIFDQIQSDDDPRLIVWSISRVEERKQGSIISSFTNVSSKRWSIHEKLERAGKTICGSGIRDRFESKSSKNKNSNLISERVIMAATIEKLIEKLTSGIDYNFLTDFFLTYRAFITPLQLCNLLILRFDWTLKIDDEQRRVVRVRTFVTLRHWLLNYFTYDFVPCRPLRSKLITYLNTLSSHPLVRVSPRDQRIVIGLKRVFKKLKKIYFRKGNLKNGNGGISGTRKKKGGNVPENVQQKNTEHFFDFDAISVEHSGVGVGTSSLPSKEKSKTAIKHESSSTLGSVLTPGTTDSEGEEFGSLKRRRSSRSRISRPATSGSSQYSEDEVSLKRTYENPILGFYDQRLAKSLPMLTKTVNDWDQDIDDKLDIESKDNKNVTGPEEIIITKKKSKLKSSSMSDLFQQRKLHAEFNPLERGGLKDDDIIAEEEPPPLPPRRRRRHTFTYTQPIPAVPPSPSIFKSGFLNFPRKPKKVVSQEIMNEKFQDRTRKKRSLSLTEAICGFAEDDDEDDDDEFDLSQIDHAGGIARRNSSPAYIESHSEKVETPRRRMDRPSWPRKMSATVGKFAKVLFPPGTGKPGGIKMLCASSEVEESGSVPAKSNSSDLNEEINIHVDGFSYVDESLDEEYYDTMTQEDFAGTEQQFNDWENPSEEEESEYQEEDDEVLASSSNPTSTQGQERDDKNEGQNIRSMRRKAKVWDLRPVMETEDEKTEDPHSVRRRRRLAKVYEVEEEGEPEVLEKGLDIEEGEEEEEHDEKNPSSHRLRRLPKLRDLRSVVTLKDHLGEKSESVKSSSEVGTETQGGQVKKKSIMKASSSEPVASSSSPGSPKKSSESSVKRTVITKPPTKKLPDIPVQHTTTTTTTTITTSTSAEPSSSSKIPIKNIPSAILKSSLDKPLPPLPFEDDRPKKPPSFSSTLNSQSPYKSFILNHRSEDIAKQFCLIERDFLSKVNWEDLVQVGYNNGKDTETENVQKFENEEKKKDIKGKGKEKEIDEEEERRMRLRKRVRENGVDKVMERFNLACDWVATEIVLTRSLEDRVQVIEKFIRVAQKCLQYSNYATLTQILLGLQSPPVERLRRTWTIVRNEDLRVFKELSEYISPFGNWKVIREAMRKSIEGSTVLIELRKSRGSDARKTSKISKFSKINTGCIPFLGLYLSDLVFNAAVPSYIDPTPPSQPSTPPSPLSSSSTDASTALQPPLINFHKHRTTATIVNRILTFQNLSREYNFPIDKEIYDKCFGLKGLEATKLVVMDLDVEDFV